MTQEQIKFFIEDPENHLEDEFEFTDIQKAYQHCEEAYGYEGIAWDNVKENGTFESLDNFLFSNGVFSYVDDGSEEMEIDTVDTIDGSGRYHLVKYDDNYADEFDISGHVVLSHSGFLEFEAAIAKKPQFTFWFGTNEEIEYNGEDGQDASDSYTAQEITQDQYISLKELDLLTCGRFAERFVESVIEATYEMEDEE